MNNISQYLSEVQEILSSGDAREHAYRSSFQRLIESLVTDIQAINEPAYTGGNAPDFLFKKGDVPIAYAECKDVLGVGSARPALTRIALAYFAGRARVCHHLSARWH